MFITSSQYVFNAPTVFRLVFGLLLYNLMIACMPTFCVASRARICCSFFFCFFLSPIVLILAIFQLKLCGSPHVNYTHSICDFDALYLHKGDRNWNFRCIPEKTFPIQWKPCILNRKIFIPFTPVHERWERWWKSSKLEKCADANTENRIAEDTN